MNYKISAPKNKINTEINLPASKSISNRALIIRALANSMAPIENLAKSDDTNVLLKVLNSNTNTFDVGAAGTSYRFLTAFLSQIYGEWILTGSQRMKERPIKILVEALRELGASIEYMENEGYPPLKITGTKLIGNTISLPGNVSSQYISALLMVAPKLMGGLKLQLEGEIISRPYIHMTLSIMNEFGISYDWNGNLIEVEEQIYKPVSFTVENDWSAASYWYQILSLIPGERITLPRLYKNSLQGDSALSDIYTSLGVSTAFTKNGIELTKVKSKVSEFTYDFVNQPDLAQTLAVNCCLLNIQFHFKGLRSLKIKETNRIEALINECGKLGYILTEPQDGELAWDGKTSEPKKKIVIDTYKDHRMAMAFAPAAIVHGDIEINDPMVVTKSYPDFYEDLKKVGFGVKEE